MHLGMMIWIIFIKYLSPILEKKTKNKNDTRWVSFSLRQAKRDLHPHLSDYYARPPNYLLLS